MAAALITVTQAKAHLKRPDLADTDADLLQKMAAAESHILSYVRKDPVSKTNAAGWISPATTPDEVQQAILLQLTEFMSRFRGDDLAAEQPAHDPDSGLSPTITSLLRRYTNPVLV